MAYVAVGVEESAALLRITDVLTRLTERRNPMIKQQDVIRILKECGFENSADSLPM